MATDIERLHKVINLPYHIRGTGHTYAKCHEICASVLVSPDDYIFCIMTYLRDIDYIYPMLWDILPEYDLKLKRNDQRYDKCSFLIGNKKVLFITEEQRHKLRGLSSYTIIYIRHWD